MRTEDAPTAHKKRESGRALLLGRAQRDAARFRTLAALTADLAAEPEPQAVLERAAATAAELLDARTVAIFLLRPDRRGFDAAAAFGLMPLEPEVPALSLEGTIAGRAIQSRAVQAVEDAAVERAAGTSFPRLVGDIPVGAILVAPIAEGDAAPLGVLEVYAAQPRSWAVEDRELLRALAAACAVALRRARLFRAAREDARRLAALNHIAEAMIGAPSFGATCDRALAALVETLDAGAGVVHVLDEAAPPERALRLVAWQGVADDAVTAWAALPLGHGAVGQAALRRSIVFAEAADVTPPDDLGAPPSDEPAAPPSDEPAAPPSDEPAAPSLDDCGTPGDALLLARHDGREGRVCVPMLAREQLLGVLTVATRPRHTWDAADFTVLETVANQLAVALEAEELRSAAAAAAAAREADRLKGELLGIVSHELRTPLGAIKGFTSGLLHHGDRLDEAARRESLRYIDEAADRLTELIDNLLDMQRLEAGRLEVAHGVVDLVEVAGAVVAEMGRHAPGHTIALDAAPDVPPVPGDARRLRQVLQNLVDNAVKYSPDGGRVTVRLASRDGGVEVRVEDEGIGIPPAHLPLVFDRFHRVDSSMTRRIGGTGLGLAIVKGLVAAHGGTITAHSEGEGHGSAFTVVLPANGAEDRAPTDGDDRALPRAKGGGP